MIEIDENDALDRREAAERFAAEMKGIGCQLLIDGFARRSVSFESLKALLVDYVKVDGTVTRNILRSGSAVAKLKAILRVGEVTGVGVIADGGSARSRALKLLQSATRRVAACQPRPIADCSIRRVLVQCATSKLHCFALWILG